MPTILLPDEEATFQQWYADWAARAGINPDPDNPEHQYDYRAAWKAGAEPQIDPTDQRYHWPSEFKADDHPNRVVDGVDTKTGAPVAPPAVIDGVDTKTGAPVAPPALPRPFTVPPAPKVAPRAADEALGGDLIPLREYLRTRPTYQDHLIGSPSGELASVNQMVQQGARALIPRLQGPVELPKSRRVVPKTLTDIQSVATQYRQKLEESGPEFENMPPRVARPYEVETPRERTTRTEIDRVLELLDDMPPEAEGA